MIAMRQAHPTFGRGTIEFVETGNRRVLAFTRTYQDDTVLVVANLSAQVQTAQVQTRLEGVPVEMLGSTRLPPLEKGAVRLTLAPYGWYWLHIVAADDPRAIGEAVIDAASTRAARPARQRAVGHALRRPRPCRPRTPVSAALPRTTAVVPRPRRDRAQRPRRQPRAGQRAAPSRSCSLAVDVEGEVDTYRYGLVLTFTSGPRGEEMLDRHPDRVLARIAGARVGTLHEVIEADAARVLMRMLTDGTRLSGRDGIFDAASQGPAVLADHEPYALMPTTLGQTVITCGAAAELKIRRRLLPGPLARADAARRPRAQPRRRAADRLCAPRPAHARRPALAVRAAAVARAVHRGRVGSLAAVRAALARRAAARWPTGPTRSRGCWKAGMRRVSTANRCTKCERMARVMGRRVAVTHSPSSRPAAASNGRGGHGRRRDCVQGP